MLFVWALIDTVLHVMYGCQFFTISETTLFKLRLDFSSHQVRKSLLVTIIRQNLSSESEFHLYTGRNWSRCDIQKANSFMLIFVKRKALKICNSDVWKVNMKMYNSFIGQVHAKWPPLISAWRTYRTVFRKFHVESKLPSTKYTRTFQCLAS